MPARTTTTPPTTPLLLPLVVLTALLIIPGASALPELDADNCPSASAIVYSPFQPWFRFYNSSSARGSQNCWNAASCLFTKADEARKQQFAATALVMGLIPLTLKDIAWPERRSVPVSRRLTFAVEALVLGLGLVPEVTEKGEEDARTKATRNSRFAQWAWGLRKRAVVALIGATAVWLLVCYAAVAVTEIYSKRVALGCPFPVWVLMWYLVGIVPGVVHAGLSRVRERWMRDWERKENERRRKASDSEEMVALNRKDARERDGPASGQEGSEKPVSAIQGADEWWVVQLAWTFYYTAGTLFFTSVMAVTVIELFVWVVVAFATTGASKLLAFFICLAFEDMKW